MYLCQMIFNKPLMFASLQPLRIGLSFPNIVSFIVLLRDRCPQEPETRVQDLDRPGDRMGQQRGRGNPTRLQ